jgi:putative membrane protein
VDAYRNLGHALTSSYLVTRHGAGVRWTVALQRSGVIGWTVSQSLFQRRAGVVTLTATTAAGHGGYAVKDVGTAEGLAVAQHAVPGLLEPFLQHEAPLAAHPLGSGS